MHADISQVTHTIYIYHINEEDYLEHISEGAFVHLIRLEWGTTREFLFKAHRTRASMAGEGEHDNSEIYSIVVSLRRRLDTM